MKYKITSKSGIKRLQSIEPGQLFVFDEDYSTGVVAVYMRLPNIDGYHLVSLDSGNTFGNSIVETLQSDAVYLVNVETTDEFQHYTPFREDG